jgi:predicted permease
VHALWHDVRFAARSLANSRGFTVVAVVTLGLGIGANTTILSLADALFLRGLSVPDARDVVHVNGAVAGRADTYPLSFPDFRYYRERSRSFADIAAHYPGSPLSLVIDGVPSSIIGSVVTANYFTILRIRPALGRFFVPAEDSVRDRDAVVVIGYGLWRERFGGAPDVIGKRMLVNGTSFTIVGVAPPGFRGVIGGMPESQVWLPSAMFRVGYRYCNAFERGCTIVQMLGRLRRGVTLADAQVELDVLARQLASAFPETNRDVGVRVVAARGATVRADQSRLVGLLAGAVGVVLLIACANLSGLLLARGLGRRKEVAVRVALGATQGRVVRQLLVETVLIALGAGAMGTVAAVWGKDLIQSLYGSDYAGRPINFSLEIGWSVLGWTLGLSMLCGIIAGLVPALESRRADVMRVLRDESTGSGLTRLRLRNLLVVSQVALSVALLVGAGLTIRSMQRLYQGRTFDPRRVVVLRLRPSLVGHESERAWRFQREVVRRLEALPGVESASPSEGIPMFGGGGEVDVSIPGRNVRGAADSVRVATNRVGARYFATLGSGLLDGREFTDRDVAGTPNVAILNDVLADRLWPRARAVGRSVLIDGTPHEVIGVVRDLQSYSLTDRPQPYLFRSYWQQDDKTSWQEDSRTHVRVRGDPHAILPALRREIAAVDPDVPISEDYALSDRVRYTFQPVRVASRALVCFALALTLSMVGLYGVLAFAVSLRTREIAIRMALGTGRADVGRLVLGQSARLAVTGAAIGVAVALAGARLLASLLYGVPTHDLTAFIGAPLVLIAVALVATLVPVRRAMRVDHGIALRHE